MVDESDRRLMIDLLKAIEHLTRAIEGMVPIMLLERPNEMKARDRSDGVIERGK